MKNMIKTFASLVLFLTFIVPSFARAGEVGKAPATGQASGSPLDMVIASAEKTEAEVLAFLLAVHQHEITAAQLAKKKGLQGGSLALADMILKDHTKAMQDVLKLSQDLRLAPKATEAVKLLGKEVTRHLATLAPLSGHELQKAFIQEAIQDHRTVLKLIDDLLLPSSSQQALIDYLNTARMGVAHHLEVALRTAP